MRGMGKERKRPLVQVEERGMKKNSEKRPERH